MDLENKIKHILAGWFRPPAFNEHDDVGLPQAMEPLVGLLVDQMLDHFQDTIDWYISEICYLQQDNEDLEVDLWLTKEDIMRSVPKIKPKRRTNFNDKSRIPEYFLQPKEV